MRDLRRLGDPLRIDSTRLPARPLTRFAPNVAQYHYMLGVALMQAGDMSAAVEP